MATVLTPPIIEQGTLRRLFDQVAASNLLALAHIVGTQPLADNAKATAVPPAKF